MELEAVEDRSSNSLSLSEEALKLMEHAKLDPTELIPMTQTLHFGEDFGEDGNYKLLELDSELLEYLNSGERLIIRGESEEPSVLCTDLKTYEIREAETSNSLLIIPSLCIPSGNENDTHSVSMKKVESIHYKYFELKQCQPRHRKLLKLLEERPYKGSSSVDFGYKWKDLINLIQSSEKEILQGLKHIKAYFLKDHWCLLDFDYHFGVLSSILNLIESNSLPLNAISKTETVETLKNLESESILSQCFDYFFKPVENSDEGNSFYQIREEEVSRLCAEVLLKPAGKFNLNEFLNIWQQSVPEGVNTSLSQLKGVALVDPGASPPVIWHFPAAAMPMDVADGFALLFDTRKKWTYEDICPYLQDYTSPKTNASSLLTKHARSSTVNGIKVYSSRHTT